jgi:hypothetical protein
MIQFVFALVFGSCVFFPSRAEAQVILPADTLRFVKTEAVKNLLPFYKELSGADLVIASNVSNLTARITVSMGPKAITKAEGLTLLETAFREQAGIIITRVSTNVISVTFNDQLKIIPAE